MKPAFSMAEMGLEPQTSVKSWQGSTVDPEAT